MKINLGITIGDPAGIGPEVTLKTIARLKPALQKKSAVFLFGDHPVLERVGVKIPGDITVVSPETIQDKALPLGRASPLTGKAAYLYLQTAIDWLRSGRISALVTAPVCKEAINTAGFPFTGHTELLAAAFGLPETGMCFLGGRMRLLLLTTHLPLKEVPAEITPSLIENRVMLAWDFLRNQLKIKQPRVLICGLNPHAGEGGLLGREEQEIFEPALGNLRQKGVAIQGPCPADTARRIYHRDNYHLLVSAYHDQLLPLFKDLYFHRGVNLTLGLPFTRTSPDHGTAFDIAGRNQARSSAMEAAVKTALRLARQSTYT